MRPLSKQIMSLAKGMPEGAPVTAKSFLHLGMRAAVDQALSRLARQGQLIRVARGLYFCPVASRFGSRPPSIEGAIEAMAAQRGETIVSSGATAANALGLTTQVPVRSVYLTSGRTRTMTIGSHVVEFRRVPRWQLETKPSGEAIRALAWLGPERVNAGLKKLKAKLPASVFHELVASAPRLPTWLAKSITAFG